MKESWPTDDGCARSFGAYLYLSLLDYGFGSCPSTPSPGLSSVLAASPTKAITTQENYI